jgi:hypothetical protein
MVGLGLVGVGVSAIQAPTAVGVAEHIDDTHRGAAMGLFHTTRFVAGVVGTAGTAAVVGAIAGGHLDEVASDTLERAFAAALVGAAAVAAALTVATRFVPTRPPTMEPR